MSSKKQETSKKSNYFLALVQKNRKVQKSRTPEPGKTNMKNEQLADANERVERAVKMTLRVFRNKSATPEEREASLNMERRLLGGDRELSAPPNLSGEDGSNSAKTDEGGES